MLRWRKRIRKLTYVAVDVLTMLASLVIAQFLFYNALEKTLSVDGLEMIGFITIALVTYIGLFLMTDIYEDTLKKMGKPNIKMLVKLLLSVGAGTAFLGSALFFLHVSLSRMFFLLFVLTYIALLLSSKAVMSKTIYSETADAEAVKNILVLGESPKGKQYIEEIKEYEYLNLNLVGYVHIKKPAANYGITHLGSLDELDSIVEKHVVDEIAVARPLSYDERLQDALQVCQDRGITVTMLLNVQNTDSSKVHVAMVGSIPVLKFHTVSLNEGQIFAKRVVDVLGAMVGMVFFGLAYLIVGPLIKLETPGPVIFKQKRVGKNGRIFEVWKFRSMGVNAEAQKTALLASNEMSGMMFKMTDDPRVTKVGAFIRKTSIDELPQFYNVLKGDMSLVGTRPPTVNEVKQYESRHRKRICITPGITGNWQVSGRSDITDFEEVVRLDSEYIANWSIWLDLKILLKTVWVVFAGRGSK